jgi:hypothetical protein
MTDTRLTTGHIDGTKNSGMETINFKVVIESFSQKNSFRKNHKMKNRAIPHRGYPLRQSVS